MARFFVDENDLALAVALAERHEAGAVLFPGHSDLPDVPRQTDDDKWLEVVGALRLVVTRILHPTGAAASAELPCRPEIPGKSREDWP